MPTATPPSRPMTPEPQSWCWNGVHKQVEWSADNGVEIDKGWIIKADTLNELAAKMGIDAAELQKTVARYNEHCRIGVDAEFDRP